MGRQYSKVSSIINQDIKAMKRRFFCLGMLSALCVSVPCLAAAETAQPVAEMRVAPHAQSLCTQAEDMYQAMTLLPNYDVLSELVRTQDARSLNTLQKTWEELRPCCESLRRLSPERLKELVLLADAVLWQSRWLESVYLEEFGIETEVPFDVGLIELSKSAKLLKDVRNGTVAVSPELAAVLRELVLLVGGDHALEYPSAWRDERVAEDYKTALQFYKDVCAAASSPDEAQAVSLLKEQEEVLDYFARKGEGEMWRVNKLAHFFHAALQTLQSRGEHPYSTPVVPPAMRTDARMNALQPFCDKLPAFKELLLR